MANLKSSKKDIRRIAKRRERNQSTRTALKTYVKKVRKAVDGGDSAAAADALVAAVKNIDKAAQKGVIHKNQAARRKSRIAKAAAAAGVTAAPAAAKPAKAAAKPKAAAASKPAAAKKPAAKKPAAKKPAK